MVKEADFFYIRRWVSSGEWESEKTRETIHPTAWSKPKQKVGGGVGLYPEEMVARPHRRGDYTQGAVVHTRWGVFFSFFLEAKG